MHMFVCQPPIKPNRRRRRASRSVQLAKKMAAPIVNGD